MIAQLNQASDQYSACKRSLTLIVPEVYKRPQSGSKQFVDRSFFEHETKIDAKALTLDVES